MRQENTLSSDPEGHWLPNKKFWIYFTGRGGITDQLQPGGKPKQTYN